MPSTIPHFQVFSLLSPSSHPTLSTSPHTKLHNLRRAHRKSKQGCKACKAKRVKCDEKWPACGRCVRVRRCGGGDGGECVYEKVGKERRDSSGRESVSSGSSGEVEDVEGVVVLSERKGSMTGSEEGGDGMVVSSPWSLGWGLQDQELLRHYDDLTRAGLLIGLQSEHYNSNVLRLAQKFTYLRHALLSIAALHLSTTTALPFHQTSHLTHLTRTLHDFQLAISAPLPRDTSDAIVITSILITIQYFSHLSSPNPSDSWVYSTDPSRLAWLSVQQGTSALLGKFRPHHCENRMLRSFSPPRPPPRPIPHTTPVARTLPEAFFTLCSVSHDMGSPGTNPNPYHDPVHALARLMPLAPGPKLLSKYIHFNSRMYLPFITLVERNDHRALLVLGYWFGLMCGVGEVWWCSERVRRDCWAICEVLSREGGEEVRELLGFPAEACGFVLMMEEEEGRVREEG